MFFLYTVGAFVVITGIAFSIFLITKPWRNKSELTKIDTEDNLPPTWEEDENGIPILSREDEPISIANPKISEEKTTIEEIKKKYDFLAKESEDPSNPTRTEIFLSKIQEGDELYEASWYGGPLAGGSDLEIRRKGKTVESLKLWIS